MAALNEAEAEQADRRQELLALGAALVTVVLWASAFVGIRAAGEDLTGGALSLGRLLVASVVLGVIVLVRSEKLPARRDLGLVLVCGVLWFGIYNVALNEAERRVDAGTAAMLVNVGPILIALLAGWLLKEGFPRTLLRGMAVAFAGVVVIGLATSQDGLTASTGTFLCLVAAVHLRGRGGGPEAAAVALVGAGRDLGRLHRGRGGLPAVRAQAGRGDGGGGRRLDRLDRLPGRVPDRHRLHHLGLRADAQHRRPDGVDHLPGAAAGDPDGLGDPGGDAARAGAAGRRALPDGRRDGAADAAAAVPGTDSARA